MDTHLTPADKEIRTENKNVASNDKPRRWKNFRSNCAEFWSNYKEDILPIATIVIALGALWQACLTRTEIDSAERIANAVRDSTHKSDSAQRAFNISQLEISRKFALQQDTFSRATLDSTGKQIAISRETMQKSLRAYLYIEFHSVEDRQLPNVFELTLTVRNSGQTPAHDVILWNEMNSRYKWVIPEQGMSGVLPDSNYARLTLNPGDSVKYEISDTLSTIEWLDVKDKSARVWALGRVTYEDAFGYPRFSNFRLNSSFSGDPHLLHRDRIGNESN
jgi:hypothetical protein